LDNIKKTAERYHQNKYYFSIVNCYIILFIQHKAQPTANIQKWVVIFNVLSLTDQKSA